MGASSLYFTFLIALRLPLFLGVGSGNEGYSSRLARKIGKKIGDCNGSMRGRWLASRPSFVRSGTGRSRAPIPFCSLVQIWFSCPEAGTTPLRP